MPIQQWKCSEIVKQVVGRTENRTTNKPNYNINMEFFMGLDEFVQEKHYWWRRKAASFATVPGQISYDISMAEFGNAGDAVEIEEMFVVNAAPSTIPLSVNPKFTPRQQIASMFGNAAIQATIPANGYFLLPGGFQILQFSQAPPDIETVAFTYYAAPMIVNVASAINQAPPLVPPNLAWGLIYMLERRVFEYLFGQNDPRFTVSNTRYEDFKLQAAKFKQFSVQEAVHSETIYPGVSSSGGRGYVRGQWWGSR